MMASLVLLQGIYTDKGITFGICVGGNACSFTQERARIYIYKKVPATRYERESIFCSLV